MSNPTARLTFITSMVNFKWIDQCRHYLETEIKTPYEWFVLDNTEKPWVSFSVANNYLASNVDTEYIGFLNDDIIFLGDPLPQMFDEFDRDPKVGLIGTKLSCPNWRINHGGVGWGTSQGEFLPGHMDMLAEDRGQADIKNYCPVTFAFAVTRTSVYRELGGLSESYHTGFEDLDYCFKLASKGLETLYIPTVPIIHIAHGSRTTQRDEWNYAQFKGKWQKEIAVLEKRYREKQ